MTLEFEHRRRACDIAFFSPASNIALAAALALFAESALAQTSPAAAAAPATAPMAEHTFTANIGLFSEYIFRGTAQTAGKPAVQGGFDYTHSSGFYAGTWASNISWLEDFGAYNGSSLEWDFYGGYKQNFPASQDWSYDLGVYGYVYPGSKKPGVFNVDTWEVYGALGWKWASLKLSYALTDYFGARPNGQKTDGTWYLDLSGTYPITDTPWAVIGHFGHLDVMHDGSDSDLSTAGKVSYNDWKLGVSYTVPEGVIKGWRSAPITPATTRRSASTPT